MKVKCGLEIHQQLDTSKLFCSCPSLLRDDVPDFEVSRLLRARAGESGEVDAAAAAEESKGKLFVYQGYHDTNCLVELDEEPPHTMNPEALRVVLQVCKMLGSQVVENIRVMRKTVIDGSNTTGFQRTALVGLGGKIGDVRVETVCIEEDACKIVERSSDKDVYNLSRLGMPLIEIATAPDISSPEQARKIAAELGMLLRSTGMVKRGIGTIRQDLNISIEGGVRVEIKGVQELRLIPTYVELEVQRQQNMIALFKELKGEVDETLVDVSDVFSLSKAKVIRSALDRRGCVLAIRLPGFKGFLGRELAPDRRFGSELSDYAKSQGVKGLFHSDELPSHGISKEEVEALNMRLGDSYVLIADERVMATRAMRSVIARAKVFSLLKEVRQALPDGTSKFLRPMPGSARMYPETDVPPITPVLEGIVVPELIAQKQMRLVKTFGISNDLAAHISKEHLPFEDLVKRFSHVSAGSIADVLVNLPKDLKKRFGVEFALDAFLIALDIILEKLDRSMISLSAVPDIMVLLHKGHEVDWDQYRPLDEKELERVIKEVIRNDPQAPVGALMGQAMKRMGGKADGKAVMAKLKEIMEETT